MEMNYKSLGKCIKIAQIKADMTQDRLSTMLDMSPSHMSNIETGRTRISLTALVNIANALGVTVDDLIYDSVVHAGRSWNGIFSRSWIPATITSFGWSRRSPSRSWTHCVPMRI